LNHDLEQLYFVNISIVFYSILARLYVCIRTLMQVLHRDYWYKLNELNGKNKRMIMICGSRTKKLSQLELVRGLMSEIQIISGASELLE